VVIDFTECMPDIRLCSVQTGVHATSCEEKYVQGISDASGVATFTIVGGANNAAGNAPGYTGTSLCSTQQTLGCAKVYADGILVGVVAVAAYDQNLSGGVNPADISAWLGDAFGDFHGRSDFDGDGALTPSDLSRLLQVALAAGSTSSCGAYCF